MRKRMGMGTGLAMTGLKRSRRAGTTAIPPLVRSTIFHPRRQAIWTTRLDALEGRQLVRRSHHGRGLARRLLDAVQDLAAADRRSSA